MIYLYSIFSEIKILLMMRFKLEIQTYFIICVKFKETKQIELSWLSTMLEILFFYRKPCFFFSS